MPAKWKAYSREGAKHDRRPTAVKQPISSTGDDFAGSGKSEVEQQTVAGQQQTQGKPSITVGGRRELAEGRRAHE